MEERESKGGGAVLNEGKRREPDFFIGFMSLNAERSAVRCLGARSRSARLDRAKTSEPELC